MRLFTAKKYATTYVAISIFLTLYWIVFVVLADSYQPLFWMIATLFLALAGLALMCFGKLLAGLDRLTWLVVALLFAYLVWLLASSFWSISPNRALLQGLMQVAFLVLFFFVIFQNEAPSELRKPVHSAFRYSLLGASICLVGAVLFSFWIWPDAIQWGDVRSIHGLAFPARTTSASGLLYLMIFWPIFWLATDSREKAAVRSLATGAATMCLGLGLASFSGVVIFAFAVGLIIYFASVPKKLKAALFLILPSVLSVYLLSAFSHFFSPSTPLRETHTMTNALLIVLLAGTFGGLLMSFLECWVKVTRNQRIGFAIFVAAAVTAGTTLAATRFDVGLSDLVALLTDNGQTRAMAWQIFTTHLATGAGTGNFELALGHMQTTIEGDTRLPSSWMLLVLSETGIVGGALIFGSIIVILTISILFVARSSLRSARLQHHDPASLSETGWAVACLSALATWLVTAGLSRAYATLASGATFFFFLALLFQNVNHSNRRLGKKLSWALFFLLCVMTVIGILWLLSKRVALAR